MDKAAFSNDEKLTSLFQPDVLVADQFAATFRARDSLGPEKRLILAVLEEAVHCFQKYISAAGRRSRALFRDAEEWIMEENSDWPFSFESSCLALGLNPGYVRRGLLHWRGQKIAQRQNRKTTAIFQQSHYAQHCNGGRKRAGALNVYQEKSTTQSV
jgi:hypothetical protein